MVSFDQENPLNTEEVIAIVKNITSEETINIFTEEDFTSADESNIIWETL